MKSARLCLLVCGILYAQLVHDCTAQTEVAGIVIDRDGKAIQGVRCRVSGFPLPSGGRNHYSGLPTFYFTDKEGRFAIALPRSDPLVDLQFDGGSHAPAFVYRARPTDSPLKVVMTEGKVLKGRIVERVNDQLVPIQHAEVELQMSQEGDWYQYRQVTDRSGEFQFRISEPPQKSPWMLYYAGKRFKVDYAQVTPEAVVVLEVNVKMTSTAEPSAPPNAAAPRR
jgi:hypothetical protein